jgi:hypothetical protein
MPTGDYYREQARILMQWAVIAKDQGVAQRLSYRAHGMLQLANESATVVAIRDAHESSNGGTAAAKVLPAR